MGSKKTRKTTKNTQTNWYMNVPSIAWVLILVSLIALVSIRRNYDVTQPVAPAAPDKAPSTSTNTWKKITNPKVLFFSKIFLQRNKTYVGIPINYESGIQTTWLILSSSPSATPTQWLVAHPVLNNLTWPSINEGTVYLYQKQQRYNSIADLLKNPPPANKIIVDESIRNVPAYAAVKGTELMERFNLNDFEYVLTTYIESDQKENELFYENIVDASSGLININEKLSWELNVPTASDTNPYSIGEVHIDYR